MNKGSWDFFTDAARESREAYLEGQPDREKQKELAERSVRKKERRRSAGWKKSWRKKNIDPYRGSPGKYLEKNKRKKPEDRRKKDRLR